MLKIINLGQKLLLSDIMIKSKKIKFVKKHSRGMGFSSRFEP